MGESSTDVVGTFWQAPVVSPGERIGAASTPDEPLVGPEGIDPVDALDTPTAGGRVIRGSAFRAGSYLTGVLLSVLSASLMIRHLGLTTWGRYVTVSSLLAIVTGLSEAGMSNLGVREYATLGGPERKRLLQNLLGIRLTLTVIGIAVAAIFAAVASYPSVIALGVLVAGGGLLVMVVQQTAGIPLIGTLRFGWASVLEVLRQAATVAFVVLLVVAGGGLLPFLAVPIPVGIALLLATLVLVGRDAPFMPRFGRTEWRKITSTTFAYVAASAVGTIYVSVTVIVTSLVGTAKETGYYGASFRIFTVLGNVPLLIVGAAFPVLARAARDDRQRLEYASARVWEMSLIVGAGVALTLAAGARFSIDVVAGPGFGPAVPVLQIQAAAILGSFLAVAFAYVLLSLHRHTALLVSNCLGLVLSLVLTLALVPSLGAKGAAIATTVGEFALAVAYFVALRRAALRLPLRIVLPVGAAAGVAATLAFVPGLSGLALAAAVGAAYVVLLFAFRAVPPEVLEAFTALTRRDSKLA
jgi:O-antigen/teichoic acid export membrane protein